MEYGIVDRYEGLSCGGLLCVSIGWLACGEREFVDGHGAISSRGLLWMDTCGAGFTSSSCGLSCSDWEWVDEDGYFMGYW